MQRKERNTQKLPHDTGRLAGSTVSFVHRPPVLGAREEPTRSHEPVVSSLFLLLASRVTQTDGSVVCACASRIIRFRIFEEVRM